MNGSTKFIENHLPEISLAVFVLLLLVVLIVALLIIDCKHWKDADLEIYAQDFDIEKALSNHVSD